MSLAATIRDAIPDIINWKPKKNAPKLNRILANALGWSSHGSRLEPLASFDSRTELSRGIVGSEAALLFVSSANGNRSKQTLDMAALFAYHASIEWGIVVSPVDAIVFNSHWIRNNDWFRLPSIQWQSSIDSLDVLEGLTPNGLTTGLIEQTATKYYEPDKLLTPVDLALVDRLDYWRDEALRYSRNIESLDEKLQTLFAQMFVLRAIEDRKLMPNLSSLAEVIRSGGVDEHLLETIMTQARKQVQSELFDLIVHRSIPDFVLGGIIHDLYVPMNLPGENRRYNFAWVGSDVLGRAYEKYLSSILVSVPEISPQLRLFEQPLREASRISVRKRSGVYYTPDFLVSYLTESALDHFYEVKSEPIHLPRIADFSCGSGSFLTKAVDIVVRRLRSTDPTRNWGREIIEKKSIVGIDNDERAVILARLSLWLRLTEEPDPLPLPSLQDVIIVGDSLNPDTFASLPSEYDIVLGNPPFIATGRFPSREELAARFKTAHGRYDYSYLFIELALQKLRGNGIVALVVPNRLFRNRDAEIVRELILENSRLLTIVDFGTTEVFTGVNAYIGSIILRKDIESLRPSTVRTIKIRELPTRLAGAVLYSAEKGYELDPSAQYFEAYDALYPRGADEWQFFSQEDRRTRLVLDELSEPLATLAVVYQGIRTGANDIFVVEIETPTRSSIVEIRNGLGEVFLTELALLRPVVYGSEIRRYDVISASRYLVYPYRNGYVIPESQLKEQFPHFYSYVSYYRSLLVERSSLIGSGLSWYELVRKRDESWLISKKLLTRDLASETSFALDEEGTTYLVGGTAVVPSDPVLLLPLMGYLNSQVANWYLQQITPSFKSGFQKFEPQHLQKLPVPNYVTSNEGIDQLSTLVQNICTARQSGNHGRFLELTEQLDTVLVDKLGIKLPRS